MGSFIEINDTLQITKEQGFPHELDIQKHLQTPLTIKDVKSKLFHFYNKPDIRVYHSPPCRCFFAENTGDDWIYWGHILIHSIQHDYMKRQTSGSYEIIKIFSPEEMTAARSILGVKKL